MKKALNLINSPPILKKLPPNYHQIFIDIIINIIVGIPSYTGKGAGLYMDEQVNIKQNSFGMFEGASKKHLSNTWSTVSEEDALGTQPPERSDRKMIKITSKHLNSHLYFIC